MNKVFTVAPDENWIVDRMVNEWNEHNVDMYARMYDANVIWLLGDWCWKMINPRMLMTKKVVTTVHHIVPSKFDYFDFNERDKVTTAYHVPNEITYEFVKKHTKKPISIIPYWANPEVFKRSSQTKSELRQKYNIPLDAYVIGSMQRDTEGFGISSGIFNPKLEKGPDILCDYIELVSREKNVHVLLSGWRRHYVIERLKRAAIPYTYIEFPPLETIAELYQCLDLYPVTSRFEGGPQSLIECGLLDIEVVSTPVGMSKTVLTDESISKDFSANSLIEVQPSIPNVSDLKIPVGFKKYRNLFATL